MYLQLIVIQNMITYISRYLQPKVYRPLLNNKFWSSTTKKIRDNDQLSNEQIQQLLGKSQPKSKQDMQAQTKKPQEGMKANAAIESTINKSSTLSISEKSLQKKQSQTSINQSTYFYGLMPLKNESYPICVDPDQIVLQQTPNQNIFSSLSLTEKCSFQQYTLALNKFRTQVDLYGDQQTKQVIQNDSLQFKELLVYDSKYLQRARSKVMVNISIPGTIECEDPRKFMQLRPIQQFRHTPLVPISDSYMQKHKQMLQRYHRKQFVFEVKQQSIINFVLMAGCLGVAAYMIYVIFKKQEERTLNFSRLKYQRLVGESTETPVFRM